MIPFENLAIMRLRRASRKQWPTSASRFDAQYFIAERLNTSGAYGTVYTATHAQDPEKKFAVKIVDRAKLSRKANDDVLHEALIMRDLVDLEGVTQLEDYFVTDTHCYLVLGLATGGDLFDRIKEHGTYDEKDARKLAYQLLKTVQQFHKAGIVHRDLKPENILLANQSDKTSILVADWGFADRLSSNKLLSRWCGTPDWVAPEILLKKPYGTSVDMWSIGCVIFATLCGNPPFYCKDNNERFRKISAADFQFSPKHWAGTSEEAKELIKGLLTVDPRKRWTAEDALTSAWFKDFQPVQGCDVQLKSTDALSQ